MASLYGSSNMARKALIGFIVISIGVLIFDNFGTIRNLAGSTDEERRFYMRSNRIFGDLPTFTIPSVSLDSSIVPQYTIQSAFSSAFPDVSYVYRIQQPRENFQFLSTFEDTAETLGFTSEPNVLGNDNTWTNSDATKTLRYNSSTQVWSLNTDLVANSQAQAARITTENISQYQSRVSATISNLQFDSRGYESGIYDIKFLNLDSNGDFILTDNALEAEFGFGTGYRSLPLADLKPAAERPPVTTGNVLPQEFTGKVYTADPRKGSFSGLFSGSFTNAANDLFTMNFINFEYTQQGAYQIITPDEGFSRVQNGEGALVSLTQPTQNYFDNIANAAVRRFSVDARRTELAFYEPQEWIGYTFPIYVYYATAELNNGSFANAVFFMDAIKRVN